MVRFEKAAASKKYHTKGTASAGFLADTYFEPQTLSFDKIVWKEGTCIPSTAGAYDTDAWKKTNHPESSAWRKPFPSPDKKGTNAGAQDYVYLGDVSKANWKDNSKFTWDIPWVYLKKGEEKEADGTLKPASKGKALFDVRQDTVSDAKGNCTISKPTLNVAAKKVEETRAEDDDDIQFPLP